MSFDFIGALLNDDPSKAAAASQQKANDLNYKMWIESRGDTGHAVLPIYGNDSEKEMFNDMRFGYSKTGVPLSRLNSAAAKFYGSQQAAGDFVGDIFSGGVTNRLLKNAQPVQSAKVAFRKQTAIDTLHKTLDVVEAMQAGKGFTGDSFGARKMRFDANRGMYSDVAGANLENLQENRSIRDYGDVQLPLQNLNTPFAMSKMAMDAAVAPEQAYLAHLAARMQPFQFFRNPAPGQYTPATPLPVGGGVSPWGAVAASLSQSGADFSKYWQSRNGGGGGYNGSVGDYSPGSWSASSSPGAGMSYGGGGGSGGGGGWSASSLPSASMNY